MFLAIAIIFLLLTIFIVGLIVVLIRGNTKFIFIVYAVCIGFITANFSLGALEIFLGAA